MIFILIIPMALFCMYNAKRAQLKNLNPLPWVISTIFAFFGGLFISGIILSQILIYQNPSLRPVMEQGDFKKTQDFLEPIFKENGLLYFAIMFAGAYGGYLFIRYILERKKMNNN